MTELRALDPNLCDLDLIDGNGATDETPAESPGLGYVTYGETGQRVSRLGLGAMRLPRRPDEGRLGGLSQQLRRYSAGAANRAFRALRLPQRVHSIDLEAAVALIRHALACGVNLLDTASLYYGSEEAIGLATADIDRAAFCLQTKIPLRKDGRPGTVRRQIEHALQRLRTHYIDVLLVHDLREEDANGRLQLFLLDARQAQGEELVRHIGFSSHDTPAAVTRLIDTAEFDCVLLQYNLLDRRYAGPIADAHARGMGVAIMGPLAGGRILRPADAAPLPGPNGERAGAVAPALRFALANPYVHSVLSGVSTIEQLDENLAIAADRRPLSEGEINRIEYEASAVWPIADLYCTGCGYCMPCPNGVNIAEILRLAQRRLLYGMGDRVREDYQRLIDTGQGLEQCIACRQCEAKCPQQLPLLQKLRKCRSLLT